MNNKRKATITPKMILWFSITIVISIALIVLTDLDRFPPNVIISLTIDVFAMFIAIIILVCYTIDGVHSGEDVTLFKMILAVDFTELLADILAWILEGEPWARVPVRAVNTVTYIMGYLLVYLFWKYVLDFVREKNNNLINNLDILLNLGMLGAICSMIINIRQGYFFTVNDIGIYERAKYQPLAYIYVYFAILFTLIVLVQNRKKFYRQQFITFVVYIMVPFIVSIITIFNYGLSILYPSIMLVILLMYSMINVARSRGVAMVNHDIRLAASIQSDALPRDFETVSRDGEFEIYASMKPAQNIGGDFYDFFMIDDDHLAMVIADVSGKGMPAALFMMESKILIKSTALVDVISPSKVLEQVNKQLCIGNKEMLFVTAWLGIFTISTGQLVYANAGHENPMLYRNGSGFNPRKEKHDPPLAIDDNILYHDEIVKLNKGDMIYVYTDGVTDAKNVEGGMFGVDRLNKALNMEPGASVKEVLKNITDTIEGFTNKVPQFDDITMLCLRYYGNKNIDKYVDDKVTSLKVEAKVENLPQVMEFINGILEREQASKSIINQIDVAVDEIFVNIARYAYGKSVGYAVIETKVEKDPDAIAITFIDEGKRYNPLKKEDPNVELGSELRDIGGLGIFIVKKTMDFLYYDHRGGNNVFTMKKYFD